MQWHPKPSFYKHPQDPEYDPDYDVDADYDAYLDAEEDRFELRRLERD